MLERLNGEDGLGAIFPAMVNALEVMVVRGYPSDDPRRVTAKRALRETAGGQWPIERLLPALRVTHMGYRVWRALPCRRRGAPAPWRGGTARSTGSRSQQLLDEPGDWQVSRPNLPGGGWAFQFANGFYPDLDDTAVIAWAMHQAGEPAALRPRAWIAP
jgi:squalene-hopene/tetraprenyl-beta-curcumene cyclase